MATTPKPVGSFNSQFKQQNELVAKELATKLKLEYGFKKDLRNFFLDLSNRFAHVYIESGQVMPANLYENDLRRLLVKHYKIISRKFSSQLRMNTKHISFNIEHKQIDQDIDNDLDGYIDLHSRTQANVITETNQSEMGGVVSSIVSAAAIDGLLVDRTEIAAQAKKEFDRRSAARLETIATTETQNMAEYSKWIEASNVNNIRSIQGMSEAQIKKQWVTVLDERTRFDHVRADGQTQFIQVPYEVGGDKLLNPGDPTLGAKPGNFINCRCSSIFILPEEPDAEYVDPTQPINISQNLVTDYVDEQGQEWGLTRGYATIYDQPGFDGTIIKKEEIDKALQKLKDRKIEWLPMYYRHNMYKDGETEFYTENMVKDKIIGWFKVDDLVSTRTGLYAEGYIAKNTEKPGWGTGTIEEIKDGKLRAYSITTTSTLEVLPNGNIIKRNIELDEISIVIRGNRPEAVLMPINQTIKPELLKPKIKPQSPVTPEAPTLTAAELTPEEEEAIRRYLKNKSL